MKLNAEGNKADEFSHEARYGRLLCVDATAYPNIRINWKPLFSYHQIGAMASCTAEPICHYSIELVDLGSVPMPESGNASFWQEHEAADMGDVEKRILIQKKSSDLTPLTMFSAVPDLEIMQRPLPVFELPSGQDSAELYISGYVFTPQGGGVSPSPAFLNPLNGDFIAVVHRNYARSGPPKAATFSDLPSCDSAQVLSIDARTSLKSNYQGQRAEAIRVPVTPGQYAACIFRLSASPAGCTSQPWCAIGDDSAKTLYEVVECADFDLECPKGTSGERDVPNVTRPWTRTRMELQIVTTNVRLIHQG